MFLFSAFAPARYGLPVPGVHASADGANVATPVSLVEWFLNFYEEACQGDVRPVEGVVRAGEVLFVPRGWWHMAINLEVRVCPPLLNHSGNPLVQGGLRPLKDSLRFAPRTLLLRPAVDCQLSHGQSLLLPAAAPGLVCSVHLSAGAHMRARMCCAPRECGALHTTAAATSSVDHAPLIAEYMVALTCP